MSAAKFLTLMIGFILGENIIKKFYLSPYFRHYHNYETFETNSFLILLQVYVAVITKKGFWFSYHLNNQKKNHNDITIFHASINQSF